MIGELVFRCLDSRISLDCKTENPSLYVGYVAVQSGLCLTLWETPRTGFRQRIFIRRRVGVNVGHRHIINEADDWSRVCRDLEDLQ